MSNVEAPLNTPVWVNESRCKACDRCVSVIHPEACIGCNDCELSCPDFAIFVADKKEYKFSKLSDEAKQRQERIIKNNYKILDEDKKV